RGEVLLAVRPQGNAVNAACLEGVTQGLAKLAATDLLCLLVIVRQQERNVEDGHDRVEAAEERSRSNRCFKRAELDALGHLALLAQLALREDLELDGAIGALLDELGDLFEMDMARLLGRLQVTDLGNEVSCPCRRSGHHGSDADHRYTL